MPTPDVPEEFLSQVGDFRQILNALQRLPGALFAIKNLESRYIYMSSALRRVIQVNPSHDVVIFHPDRLAAKDWRSLVNEFDGSKEARDAMLSIAQACEKRSLSGGGCELTSVEVELDAREFTKLRKLLSVKQLLNRTKPAIKIRRGRGGRVQRRMVAELPKGLDGVARKRVAHRFAGYLADKKMMYTVVVHAPGGTKIACADLR